MRNLLIISVTLLLVANSCKWDLDFIEEPGTGLPIAEFSLNNNFCVAPCDPGFINQSQNATTYTWDWGDGTPQTTLTPADAIAHTYAAEGNYQVVLTAGNGTNSSTFTLEANIFGDVVPDFTIINDGCKAPCEITFQNTSTGADSFEWDFGDGSPTMTTTNTDDVTHTYTKGGTYTTTLTATGQGSMTSPMKSSEVTINFETWEYNNTQVLPSSGTIDNDGNYILSGTNYGGSFGVGQLIKLSRDGNLLKEVTIPDQSPLIVGTIINSIITLQNGELVATGCSQCGSPVSPQYWSMFYFQSNMDYNNSYHLENEFPNPTSGKQRGNSIYERQNGNLASVGQLGIVPGEKGYYVEFENGTNTAITTNTYIDDATLDFVYESPSNGNVYALSNHATDPFADLGNVIRNITTNDSIAHKPPIQVLERKFNSIVENNNEILGFTGSETNSILFGTVNTTLSSYLIINALPNTDGGIGHSIIATEDNGFVIVGQKLNNGLPDVIILKVDQNGIEQWRAIHGLEADTEYGLKVMQTADGGFIIFGRNGGSFYCLKTDDQGKIN